MKPDRTKTTRTGQILKSAAKALAANDSPSFADHLIELVQAEPQRWKVLLHLANVMPEPGSRQFADRLKPILEGLRVALDRVDGKIVSELMHLLHSIVTVEAVIHAIRQTLESLEIWKRPNQETMFRLAAFLEDQFRLLEMKQLRDAGKDGFFDPLTLATDSLAEEGSPNVVSPLAAFENLCESLPLIHTYMMHEKGGVNGTIEDAISPYDDADFKKLLMLAAIWRSIKDLWGWIRYHGWQATVLPDQVLFYGPADPDDFLRYNIGLIRREFLKTELFGSAAPYAERFTDTTERLSELAASIVLEGTNLTWQVKLDTALFASICKLTRRSVTATVAMEILHYEKMARDLKIGKGSKQISWNQFFACADALAVLCSAYTIAAREQIQRTNDEFSPQQVFLVQEERLATVLAKCTNLSLEIVKMCIERLCFNIASRSLEAWDAPLIRINSNLLLVTPVLAKTGDAIRMLENMASEWDERLFTDRGPLLEREAISFLAALDGVVAAGPVTFTSSSENRKVEFDVVARWEDQIFLIEAKCTKLVFGARDLYRARAHIDEAVDQLVLRKRVLLNEWQQMKAILPDVCRENNPLPPDRISMIVLTNVPYFTAAKLGDVLVVDEFVFRRFFESPMVHAIAGGQSPVELFSIRQGSQPTATEFREYLANPPQIAAIEKVMKPGFFYHTVVRDGGPKIISIKYEFQGFGQLFDKIAPPIRADSKT